MNLETLLQSWAGESVIVQYDQETGAWIFIAIFSTRLGPAAGGTRMPTAQDCLKIAGCVGKGSAPKLAELCAGLSLAGEISITAALCAGDFATAHAVYGRPPGGDVPQRRGGC